ncbi:MAG: hypothetical protein LWY06_05925 [Firmicutes bacterium]|nr:hypothetical protein [Bacillota bacterium]
MINSVGMSSTPVTSSVNTAAATPAKTAETQEKPLVSTDKFTSSFSSQGVSSYEFKETMKKVKTVTLAALGAIGGAIGGSMAGAAGGVVGGVVGGIAGAVTGGLIGGAAYAHNKPGFEGIFSFALGAIGGGVAGGIGGALLGVGAGAAAGVVGGVTGAVAGAVGGVCLSQLKISIGT